MTFTRHAILLFVLALVGASALAAPRPQFSAEQVDRDVSASEAEQETKAAERIQALLNLETHRAMTTAEANLQLLVWLLKKPDPTLARLAFKQLAERDPARIQKFGGKIADAFIREEAAVLQSMHGSLTSPDDQASFDIEVRTSHLRHAGPKYRSTATYSAPSSRVGEQPQATPTYVRLRPITMPPA